MMCLSGLAFSAKIAVKKSLMVFQLNKRLLKLKRTCLNDESFIFRFLLLAGGKRKKVIDYSQKMLLRNL